jgi:MtN3 and saliva related transmembrane protein
MIPRVVAILAPTVNCIQLLPQLYKTYKTKSAEDLSLYTLLLILATNILWLLHGYFIKDNALLVSAYIGLLINSMVFGLYIKYR